MTDKISVDTLLQKIGECKSNLRYLGKKDVPIGDLLKDMDKNLDHNLTSEELYNGVLDSCSDSINFGCGAQNLVSVFTGGDTVPTSGATTEEKAIALGVDVQSIRQEINSITGTEGIDLNNVLQVFSKLLGFDVEILVNTAKQMGVELDISKMTLQQLEDILEKIEDYVDTPEKKILVEHAIDCANTWGQQSFLQKTGSAFRLVGDATVADPWTAVTELPDLTANLANGYVKQRLDKSLPDVPILKPLVKGVAGGGVGMVVGGATLVTTTATAISIETTNLLKKPVKAVDNLTGGHLQATAHDMVEGIRGVDAGAQAKIDEQIAERRRIANQMPSYARMFLDGSIANLRQQVKDGKLTKEEFDFIQNSIKTHKNVSYITHEDFDKLSKEAQRALDLANTASQDSIVVRFKDFYQGRNGAENKIGTFSFFFRGMEFESWNDLVDFRKQNGLYDADIDKDSQKYPLMLSRSTPDFVVEEFNRIATEYPLKVDFETIEDGKKYIVTRALQRTLTKKPKET